MVVAVVLVAVIGGWYYLNGQDEKASLELSQAVRTMDTPAASGRHARAQPDFPTFASAKERAQAAKKQFQAIVDKYRHTRTADMAHYFLGVTAVSLGDNASAESNFKEVISAGNRQVSSLAKDALAAFYANTGRVKESVALYQELINKPTDSVSKVTAQFSWRKLIRAPTNLSTPSACMNKSRKTIPPTKPDRWPRKNWQS